MSLGRYAGTGSAGPVDAAFAQVWTVDDGRITKFVQYADTRRFGTRSASSVRRAYGPPVSFATSGA